MTSRSRWLKTRLKYRLNKELTLKELELKALEQASKSAAADPPLCNRDVKSLKLPTLYELGSYLLLLKATPRMQSGRKYIKLSALLTGRAMHLYTRMSDRDANNYDKSKKALVQLHRRWLQKEIQGGQARVWKMPDQFVFHLKNYLAKW